MADSKEQLMINNIVTRLKLILTTNGYVTNIGARVEDSRTNWDAGDPTATPARASELPAISVFELPVEPVESNDNLRTIIRLMGVQIRVFFDSQDTATANAAYARNAIKDIYRAIRGAQTDRDAQLLAEQWPVVFGVLPGLAMQTREGRHSIDYAPDSFEITGVQVTIGVMYKSGKWNLEA